MNSGCVNLQSKCRDFKVNTKGYRIKSFSHIKEDYKLYNYILDRQ